MALAGGSGIEWVLRGWLGWHPEEKEWLMTCKARRALAIVLTTMMGDGEVTRERAREIAMNLYAPDTKPQ